MIEKSLSGDFVDVIRVKNTHSTICTANSFAQLESYDSVAQVFRIDRPDSDSISTHEVVICPFQILPGEIGIAYRDGIHVVAPGFDQTNIAAGDGVGTYKDEWTAKKDAAGFHVISVLPDKNLVVRPLGGNIECIRVAHVQRVPLELDAEGQPEKKLNLSFDLIAPESEWFQAECFIFGPENLYEAVPWAYKGAKVLVSRIDGAWKVIFWFNVRIRCNEIAAAEEE